MPSDGAPRDGDSNGICPFTGKRRYETKQSAKVAFKQTQNPGRHRARREQRVVFCDGCLGWHLTSASRKR